MRAFLSLVIAVVLSIAGHLLVWGGGSSILRLQQEAFLKQPDQVILPTVFLVLGLICLAGAMLTAAWSSLGVIIIGLVQTVTGIGIVVLPAAIYAGTMTSIEGIYRPVGDGLFTWWTSGLGLITGLVFFVGGIAIAARRQRSTAAGRVATTVLSVVLGAGVALLLAFGGARLIQSIERNLPGIELLGVLLVLAAAVLTVIVVAGVRFSSLGAIILGILLGGLGGLLVWAPLLVLRPIRSNGALTVGLSYAGGGGGYLVLGVLVLVAGIAGLVRASRKRAAEPASDVEEHIGYQTEQPSDDVFPFLPAGDHTATGPVVTGPGTTAPRAERAPTGEPPADRV